MVGNVSAVLAFLGLVIVVVIVVMGGVAWVIYRKARILNGSKLAANLAIESAGPDSVSRAADATNLVNMTVGVFRAVGGILAFTGAVAIGVVSYSQQQEQFQRKQEREFRNTNADRFKVAIDLLADTDVSRTEGAIIIMEGLLREDAATFIVPVRNSYRAKLIGLQNSSDIPRTAVSNPEPSAATKRDYLLVISTRSDGRPLSSGTEAARFWRLLQEYVRLAPTGANPTQIDLSFLQVAGLDFGSVLGRRDSLSALPGGSEPSENLRRQVSLVGAILPESSFKGIDLREANFRDAKLRRSSFVNASLIDAVFRRADLQDSRFTGSDLTNADLVGADLTYAGLAGARLDCANLDGADLDNAEIDPATLAVARITPSTRLPKEIDYNAIKSYETEPNDQDTRFQVYIKARVREARGKCSASKSTARGN